LTGRGLFEVFPPDPDPSLVAFESAVRASLQRVLSTRRPDKMTERAFVVPLPDGGQSERFLTATNAPIFGPDGAVAQILIATLDVTGEVLERRGDEARRLLMREVDHRARNALTVVQSFVRLTTAATLEEFRHVVDGPSPARSVTAATAASCVHASRIGRFGSGTP
jgi:two-component sensor histidine kinase